MKKFESLAEALFDLHKEIERPFGEGLYLEAEHVPEVLKIAKEDQQDFTSLMHTKYGLITMFMGDDIAVASREEFKASGGFIVSADQLDTIIEENDEDVTKIAKALDKLRAKAAN